MHNKTLNFKQIRFKNKLKTFVPFQAYARLIYVLIIIILYYKNIVQYVYDILHEFKETKFYAVEVYFNEKYLNAL